MVLLGRFLINQIALRRAVHKHAFAVELFIPAGGSVHIVVQGLPVDGGKSGVAGGERSIANVVIHFARLIDGITEFLQRAADQQGLEGLFRNGALNRLNGNAFARQIRREGGGGNEGG